MQVPYQVAHSRGSVVLVFAGEINEVRRNAGAWKSRDADPPRSTCRVVRAVFLSEVCFVHEF